MAHVKVSINGRIYKMGCHEGEQSRVLDLAAEVDSYVKHIRGAAKAVPDDRLIVMAAIMIADQLWDARDELQRTLKQIGDFRSYQVIDGGGSHANAREPVTRAADISNLKPGHYPASRPTGTA